MKETIFVSTANMKGVREFITYTAARHQGAIQMFCEVKIRIWSDASANLSTVDTVAVSTTAH